MLNGTVSVYASPGAKIQLSTIYTDSCTEAVDFYQLIAQKTNGAIVLNVIVAPTAQAQAAITSRR